MRLELIHPVLVHFPIALLSIGTLLRLAAFFTAKKPRLSFLLPAATLILLLGVISAWISIIFGEIAKDIVESTIKNISILREHEEHAYLTAYGFTLALAIDWGRRFLINKRKHKGWMVNRGLAVFIWFFYFFGFVNLLVAGFFGGELVYEEGAAIHRNYDK